MTLKDKIENNIVLVVLGLLLTGFSTGFGTHKVITELFSTPNTKPSECSSNDWETEARKAQWIPDTACPAYSLDIKITSPGNGSDVSLKTHFESWFYTPIVVSSTRPLTSRSNIGIVLKPSDSPNYFVVFPGFSPAGSNNVFRTEYISELPFTLRPKMKIELRALVVDSKDRVGVQFSSIEQIRSTDASVHLSEPIQVQLR